MGQENFRLSSASVSERGLSEKRPQNEDSFAEVPERGLFVVADGVGGAQAGDVASQMAVEMLNEAFAYNQKSIDFEDLMKIAIERANSAIFQASHEVPQLRTMATTVVALHLDGYIATIGHVGDSRLYRLDPRGNLFRETQDHSVVEEEVRAGRMTLAQAATHPSRNVISRALGAENQVEVDLKTIMYEPNTRFLLCSDGITRHLSDIEIRELLITCNSPVEACREMKNLCYSRGAEDNLTAIVVKVDGFSDEVEDDEENTVTNPRFSTISLAANGEENHTQNLNGNANIQYNTSKLSVPAQLSQESAIFRVEGGSGVSSEDDVRLYEQMQVERTQIIKSSRGNGKRILWAILWFILGAILGGVVYHFVSVGISDSMNQKTISPTTISKKTMTLLPATTEKQSKIS